jgi:glycerol-3-phosphate acyltransferase PlsY
MADLGILLLAFVAGSIPFSNLVTLRARGVDLRDTDYNAISGTAVYRVAGFGALVVSGIADVAKGALGPLLAGTDRPVLAALAGGAAVVGHNWSPFLRGLGGRGVGPAAGVLLVTAWPGLIVLFGGMIAGRIFRQTGLGGFFGEAALAPVLAVTNGPSGALAGAAVAVPMLVKRVLGNALPTQSGWRPYAHRLLLDRDPDPDPDPRSDPDAGSDPDAASDRDAGSDPDRQSPRAS